MTPISQKIAAKLLIDWAQKLLSGATALADEIHAGETTSIPIGGEAKLRAN
jgi:hypothetical protein